jgi:hypothetical protein
MMIPTSMRFLPFSRHVGPRVWLAGLCISAIVSGGCAERNVKVKVKTFPWGTTAKARPIVPQMVDASYERAADDFSEFELDVTPPPSPLVAVNGAPARPHVPAAPSGGGNAARFEPPTIVPQLTAQETEAAQQQTNLSLSIAERNIGSTQGRTLNPAQSDLVSKVRSFVSEAREAAHHGDWTRASNAAKKAQVLSEELARSL